MRPRLNAADYAVGSSDSPGRNVASMRPRLNAADYTGYARPYGWQSRASMRPRLNAADYIPYWSLNARYDASMRPRLNAADYIAFKYAIQSRFNEAAAECRGSHQIAGVPTNS